MIDKVLSELIVEVKKIRADLDKMQAYQKTIAENTTPAENPAETNDET
jgi:hypothetical protein